METFTVMAYLIKQANGDYALEVVQRLATGEEGRKAAIFLTRKELLEGGKSIGIYLDGARIIASDGQGQKGQVMENQDQQAEIERLHLQLDKYNELATSADYFLNNPDASKLEGYHWLLDALKSLGYRNPDIAAKQGQEGQNSEGD